MVTPYEFKKKVMRIIKRHSGDTEYVHIELDIYLWEVMRSIGYGDGVDLIESQTLWYS